VKNNIKKKILIVDDDLFIKDIYSNALNLEGFQVVTSSNGEEGLKKIFTEKPDLVLLDILMPIMDGLTMLEKLRASDESMSSIPVIILSNLGQKEDIDKALNLGANDFLIKSQSDVSQIIDRISNLLKNLK